MEGGDVGADEALGDDHAGPRCVQQGTPVEGLEELHQAERVQFFLEGDLGISKEGLGVACAIKEPHDDRGHLAELDHLAEAQVTELGVLTLPHEHHAGAQPR